LEDYDVLLLQEMDEVATDAVAKALNCNYIYYPSINHPGQRKLVGNAILSKWPIVDHEKVLLPHPSLYPVITKFKTYKFRKIATVAHIDINGVKVKFYSIHGAAFNTSKARKALAGEIADDINRSESDKVVVGGDFNTVGYGDILSTIKPFKSIGMEWATEKIGRTIGHKKWMVSFFPSEAFQTDHIFVKGLEIMDLGKIENTIISDHYPLWINLRIED
jgi:endonuclease/exonuclease/phosphatase family metal-dependent hydrolase